MKSRVLGVEALLLWLLFVLSGCTPGEAEFTMKTSEVLRALKGDSARIRVHETMAIPLSNAYKRVTFGGERFTNQLDVVKALVAKQKKLFPLNEFFCEDEKVVGELTNDVLRLTVDESVGHVPLLRMEADFAVWLSQTNVFERAIRERGMREMVVCFIDASTGAIDGGECFFQRQMVDNPRFCLCSAMLAGQGELIDILWGEGADSSEGLGACLGSVVQAWQSALFPTWFKNLSCVVVGDSDERLTIEAEDVIIDGRHHDSFKTVIKRGETLRMKINKKRDNGGVRFCRSEAK